MSRLESIKPLARGLSCALNVSLLAKSGAIIEQITDEHLPRDVLPGPIDLASHIGNFNEGSAVTVMAGILIGGLTCLDRSQGSTSETFKKKAKFAAATAFLFSTAVQIVGERYHLSNIIATTEATDTTNVGDMIDAAYGIFWSGVTAGVGYKYATRTEKCMRKEREKRRALWRERYDSGYYDQAVDQTA